MKHASPVKTLFDKALEDQSRIQATQASLLCVTLPMILNRTRKFFPLTIC